MSPSLASLGALAAVLLRTAAAAAEPSSDTGDARYAWLLSELRENGNAERTWWTTWTASYAVLTAGQGGAVWVLPDEGLRIDAGVGAVKSALGLLVLLVAPRPAIGAASTLQGMDASTPEARGLRRARAEELLHASAKEEAFGTSWVPHVAAAVTNLAGAYFLFHEHQRYVPGWISLASGTVVAELQIITKPKSAITAWNRYAGGAIPMSTGRTTAPPITLSIAPTVILLGAAVGPPAFGGFALRGSF